MDQLDRKERLVAMSLRIKALTSLRSALFAVSGVMMLVALFGILFPRGAEAQEVAFMATLQGYEKVILGYEQNVTKYLQQIEQHEQQVIAPATQITSTQHWLSLAQSQYNGWFSQVNALSINSAVSPGVSAFQTAIQGGGTALSVHANYVQVYGSQPSSTGISSSIATAVDATDTAANEALTLANTSDLFSKQFITLANSLESAAASSAPGNATMIEAQSQAMQLHSNAVMHRLIASMLRQQAAQLGEQSASIKNAAAQHKTAAGMLGLGGN
jgi:hypothetical protein